MLFISDYKSKICKFYFILNDRMGSNHNIRFPGSNLRGEVDSRIAEFIDIDILVRFGSHACRLNLRSYLLNGRCRSIFLKFG